MPNQGWCGVSTQLLMFCQCGAPHAGRHAPYVYGRVWFIEKNKYFIYFKSGLVQFSPVMLKKTVNTCPKKMKNLIFHHFHILAQTCVDWTI